MADRYCVVEKESGGVVDAIMLDGPQPETAEFRYVQCDGSAGIGWTFTAEGPVQPAESEMHVTTPATLADEIAALQAKLDSIREASK